MGKGEGVKRRQVQGFGIANVKGGVTLQEQIRQVNWRLSVTGTTSFDKGKRHGLPALASSS